MLPNIESKEVVKRVSLEIPPGKMIALVGESGSGKVTQSFYDSFFSTPFFFFEKKEYSFIIDMSNV